MWSDWLKYLLYSLIHSELGVQPDPDQSLCVVGFQYHACGLDVDWIRAGARPIQLYLRQNDAASMPSHRRLCSFSGCWEQCCCWYLLTLGHASRLLQLQILPLRWYENAAKSRESHQLGIPLWVADKSVPREAFPWPMGGNCSSRNWELNCLTGQIWIYRLWMEKDQLRKPSCSILISKKLLVKPIKTCMTTRMGCSMILSSFGRRAASSGLETKTSLDTNWLTNHLLVQSE